MSTKIMLVDADLSLLRAMRSEAASSGGSIELLTAQTWDAAFELLTIADPVLVVGAVERATSPELALLVQVQRRGLDVAAFGPKTPEMVRVAAAAGIDEYIGKPISSADFLIRLRRLIRASSSKGKPALTGFALADLLQLVSMSRQNMTLLVRSGDKSGELVVAEGMLVHAEAGDRRGLDAALSVLDWPNSEVSSSPDIPPTATWTTEVSLMELLVDAARLRDERQRDDANHVLERLVSEALELPGVVAAALIHVASRTEIHGDGTAGTGRTFARDLVLDALALAEGGTEGEQPVEIQMSLGSCDVLGCTVGASGVVMIAWCAPGELRSGTQLALRRARERDAERTATAFSTVGVDLADDDDFRLD